MHEGKVTALDTLHDGLARDAQAAHRLRHGYIALRGLGDKEVLEFPGHADAPGSPGGHLFAGDEAVHEPAVQRGGGQPELVGGPLDGEQLPLWQNRGG